jgi:hypothetical protein
VKLWPVSQHQGDRVTAADADGGQPWRGALHPLGVLFIGSVINQDLVSLGVAQHLGGRPATNLKPMAR